MTGDTLRRALEDVVATVKRPEVAETDPFEAWRLRQNPPIAREALQSIVDQLQLEPGAEIFSSKMQAFASGALRVTFDGLARWLADRAWQVGSEQAVADLREYLTKSEFRVLSGHGIRRDRDWAGDRLGRRLETYALHGYS